MTVTKILKAIAPQLLLLAALGVIGIFAELELIPSLPEINSRVIGYIAQGGFGVVALFSFLENLPGINAYFPGSVVLVARMGTTHGDPGLAVSTYLAILIPAMIANTLTFLLGTRFVNRSVTYSQAQSTPTTTRLKSSLWLWYFTTYWHPHLAALTALAAGAKGVGFSRHLATFLPISLLWSVIWAVLLYNLGAFVDVSTQLTSLVFVYLVLWIAWDLRGLYREEHVDSP